MIKIDINDKEVQTKLSAIARQLKQPRKLYGVLGETIKKLHQGRFKKEISPDGKKWKSLSPATVELKRKRGKSQRILRQDGYLSDKTAYNYDDKRLEFGSDAKYARLHQFGGQAGRGRKVNIPARPWLGVSDNDKRRLLDKAQAVLKRQLEKL